MTCLHTISRSPSANLLPICASMLSPGDALLFIEDGTYYCSRTSSSSLKLLPAIIYVLKDDLLARGTLDRCIENVEIIDYDKFVDLCCEYEKVISWF